MKSEPVGSSARRLVSVATQVRLSGDLLIRMHSAFVELPAEVFVKSCFAGLKVRGLATQLRRPNALRSRARTDWLLLFFQHS